jgi:hypothetical protein
MYSPHQPTAWFTDRFAVTRDHLAAQDGQSDLAT